MPKARSQEFVASEDDRSSSPVQKKPREARKKQAKREQTPSSDSESSEEKPLKKRSKKAEPAASSNKKQESAKGRSESPETKRKVGATAKYGSGVETKTNAEGDKYVELAKNRRATVRSFKDKVYVDIRETYEKDGEAKPGKKGIMLNVEQWDRLKKAIAALDKEIDELA
ncbi:hypothetical protein JCM8202_003808 [Rhodotorula sphaerocarpa]